MFDFGIPGYQPQWQTGVHPIAPTHGHRLAALPGRTLACSWCVWDHATDTWFTDGPILLDFDGIQVEINHQKLDELSITWNSIDPTRPINWPADGFDLRWRAQPPNGLAALPGRPLQAVDLLEWSGTDLAKGTLALCFTFPGRQATIHNGLDQNSISFEPPDPRYTRHTLPPAPLPPPTPTCAEIE